MASARTVSPLRPATLASLAVMAAVGALLPLARAHAGDAPADESTYEGGNTANATGYVKGKPVSITHSSGNLSVHCMDTETLSTRMQYVVSGTAQDPMEATGKGIGLAAYGDSNGGRISTRVPGKQGGVSDIEVTLSVSIPRAPLTLNITNSGSGWVQVQDCDGTVNVHAGAGGAFASGAMNAANVTASGGDVKVVEQSDAVFKSPTTVSAPGGNATLLLGTAQGGKITVKGATVSVGPTVMGTNTATLVSGDLGLGGTTISVSAKETATVNNNQ